MLFDVGGVNSFRVSGQKSGHQERCHSCFRTVIMATSISTVVVEWRFPVAPWTPHGGG